jgi:hypothetical protein
MLEEEAQRSKKPRKAPSKSHAEILEAKKDEITKNAEKEVKAWLQKAPVLSRAYLSSLPHGTSPDPVLFWLSSSQRREFPLLSAVYLHLALLSPHSAEPERMASTAGHLDAPRRSTINSDGLALVAHYYRTNTD